MESALYPVEVHEVSVGGPEEVIEALHLYAKNRYGAFPMNPLAKPTSRSMVKTIGKTILVRALAAGAKYATSLAFRSAFRIERKIEE